MGALIRLLRPRQWSKNTLVFAGIIFSQHYGILHDWLLTLQVFAIFSIAASGIYIINDLFDVEKDRLHPSKRNRPIASGEVLPLPALLLALILIAVAVTWSWTINTWVLSIVAGYIAVMILYSAWLKHILLVDVFLIATGFTARAVVGAAAIEVMISKWLTVCAFFIGLSLALVKRRQEIARLNGEVELGRRSLHAAPPLHVWDLWIMMISAITILAYTLYTFDPVTVAKVGSQRLMYTTPIVVFALLRYQVGVYTANRGEDPTEAVLTDPWILLAIAGWILLVLLILLGVM